ncbi:MAG: patatin-like phospholipase family protein [Alphaproteobacteria bacterium GM202ARS2]|nr:patatin-like phospholipase family protein [Alphaproteobacteria bacterium GM202ARS2]
MTYRILSIDGGGIIGLMPALILQAIEKKTDKKIGQLFDVILGTSIGGIMACGFAKPNPKSADDMVRLFREQGEAIFSRTFAHMILSLGGLTDPIYQEHALEDILQDILGDTKLSEVETDIFVTSYKLATKKNKGNDPLFFNSWRARESVQRDYYLRDVARATSAAPVYFVPETIRPLERRMPDSLVVDGGVVAANPSLCGYLQTQPYHKSDDIVMLSLGTGFSKNIYESADVKDWGAAQWVAQLPRLFIEGGSDYAHNSMDTLLNKEGQPKRYFRYNIALDGDEFALDATDSDTLDRLSTKAQVIIDYKTKTGEMDELLQLINPTS